MGCNVNTMRRFGRSKSGEKAKKIVERTKLANISTIVDWKNAIRGRTMKECNSRKNNERLRISYECDCREKSNSNSRQVCISSMFIARFIHIKCIAKQAL